MTAPDLTEKVVGYRAFNVTDGELASTGVGARWLPGVNKARCLKPTLERTWRRDMRSFIGPDPYHMPEPTEPHAAPSHTCDCGLYALHQMPKLWPHGELLGEKERVGAMIRAWGRLEIHQGGFRAEYAELALLIYEPLSGIAATQRARDLASTYGVEACAIDAMAERPPLGRGVPENLLPPPPPSMEESVARLEIARLEFNASAAKERLSLLAAKVEDEAKMPQKRKRWFS